MYVYGYSTKCAMIQSKDETQNMVHYLMRVCMTHTYGCTYIYTPSLLLSLPLSTFLTLSPSLPPSSFLLLVFLPLFNPSSLSSILHPSLHSFLPLFTPSSLSSLLPPSIPPSPLPSLLPSLPPSPLPSFPPSLPSQQILM